MMAKYIKRFPRYYNILSLALIGLSTALAIELPAIAKPTLTSIATSENNLKIAQVRSRAIAPRSLRITPPPGSHIPLPEGNYHNRRYHPHYRGRYFHRQRHNRKQETIIIINPSVYPHDRGLSGSRNYIRVIRKK